MFSENIYFLVEIPVLVWLVEVVVLQIEWQVWGAGTGNG